ncbi:MAG: C10 family peptidase [Bacteroidaceae bacterium]|nr:C10 family peptidase [Bacteroidaceae bacterium]
MKRSIAVLITLLFAMFATTVAAQVSVNIVSESEAQSVAREMLNTDVTRVNVEKVSALQRKAQNLSQSPAYYIFNSTAGNGFVIVSGEKGTEQVLAYSDEGTFDPSKVQFGADAFLNIYDDHIAQIRSGKKVSMLRKQSRRSATPILLNTILWSQSGNFFNQKYAPEVNSQKCLSGCGPTAMAIIMQYWQYPVQGRGTYSYTTERYKLQLNCDFNNEFFDWTLMTASPQTNSAESDAVSRLMLDCGIAMSADYGPSVTYGYLCSLAQGIKDHFYYTNPRYLMRNMDNIGDWDEVIENELINGRPCIVAAQGTDNRHIFVVDGINSKGLLHYNLGWGGSNNGYYLDGVIAGNNYRYATDELLIGIQPDKNYKPSAGISFSNVKVMDASASYTLNEIQIGRDFSLYYENIWNLGPYSHEGRNIRVELRDKDCKTKYVVSSEDSSFSNPRNYYNYWFYIVCRITSNMQLDEEDRLWLCSQDIDGEYLPVCVIDDEHSSVALKDYISGLPSGIQSIANTPQSFHTKMYDLTGREVNRSAKGLFIRNGKKVLVK